MRWRAPLIVAALAAVLIGYYLVHKPLDPDVAAALGGMALDALTLALIALITGGIGRRALARFGWKSLSRAERVALEGLTGLGLASLGALMFGLIGLYSRGWLWGGLGGAALVCLPALTGWARDFRRALAAGWATLDSGWTRFLGTALSLLIASAALHAFAPPSAWDALAYHLAGPQAYLADGAIRAHPENFFLGFPQNVETLFGAAISLFGRESAAAPLHAWYGLLGLLAVGGLIRRYTNPGAALIALLALLIGHSFWLLFGWAYVDLAVFAYGAGALIALLIWRESEGSKARWPLILAGVLLGFAVGVKYVAGAGLVGAAIYILASLLHRNAAPDRIRRAQTALLVLAGAATLVYLPWAVKGAALYENPIYPFVLNGLNWDSVRAAAFSGEGTLIERGGAWQLAVMPVAATLFGVEKGDIGSGYFFTAGPWILTLPLLIPLVWRWLDERARRLGAAALIFGGGVMVAWIGASAVSNVANQTRFILIGFPAAAAGCGVALYGLGRAPRRPLDVGFMMRVAFAATVCLGSVEALTSTVDGGTLHYLLAADSSRDSYLTERLGTYYGAMQRLEGIVPAGSTLRLMWEPRAAYCPARVKCLPDVALDHWVRPLRLGQTPDVIFVKWKAEGVAYLLVSDTGFDFALNEDARFAGELTKFKPALAKWMEPVWTDRVSYTLYTWR